MEFRNLPNPIVHLINEFDCCLASQYGEKFLFYINQEEDFLCFGEKMENIRVLDKKYSSFETWEDVCDDLHCIFLGCVVKDSVDKEFESTLPNIALDFSNSFLK